MDLPSRNFANSPDAIPNVREEWLHQTGFLIGSFDNKLENGMGKFDGSMNGLLTYYSCARHERAEGGR